MMDFNSHEALRSSTQADPDRQRRQGRGLTLYRGVDYSLEDLLQVLIQSPVNTDNLDAVKAAVAGIATKALKNELLKSLSRQQAACAALEVVRTNDGIVPNNAFILLLSLGGSLLQINDTASIKKLEVMIQYSKCFNFEDEPEGGKRHCFDEHLPYQAFILMVVSEFLVRYAAAVAADQSLYSKAYQVILESVVRYDESPQHKIKSFLMMDPQDQSQPYYQRASSHIKQFFNTRHFKEEVLLTEMEALLNRAAYGDALRLAAACDQRKVMAYCLKNSGFANYLNHEGQAFVRLFTEKLRPLLIRLRPFDPQAVLREFFPEGLVAASTTIKSMTSLTKCLLDPRTPRSTFAKVFTNDHPGLRWAILETMSGFPSRFQDWLSQAELHEGQLSANGFLPDLLAGSSSQAVIDFNRELCCLKAAHDDFKPFNLYGLMEKEAAVVYSGGRQDRQAYYQERAAYFKNQGCYATAVFNYLMARQYVFYYKKIGGLSLQTDAASLEALVRANLGIYACLLRIHPLRFHQQSNGYLARAQFCALMCDDLFGVWGVISQSESWISDCSLGWQSRLFSELYSHQADIRDERFRVFGLLTGAASKLACFAFMSVSESLGAGREAAMKAEIKTMFMSRQRNGADFTTVVGLTGRRGRIARLEVLNAAAKARSSQVVSETEVKAECDAALRDACLTILTLLAAADRRDYINFHLFESIDPSIYPVIYPAYLWTDPDKFPGVEVPSEDALLALFSSKCQQVIIKLCGLKPVLESQPAALSPYSRLFSVFSRSKPATASREMVAVPKKSFGPDHD